MRWLKLLSAVLLAAFTVLLIVSFFHYDNQRVAVWSASITAWAAVVLAVVTVWAVIYQTTTADRVSQVQMLQSFAERFDSEAFANARRRLSKQLLSDGKFHSGDAVRVLDFFERIAFFVRREHLRYEVVENDYSLALRSYWSRLKDYVVQMRVDYADPTFYEHTEWLNDKFVKAYAQASGSTIEAAEITEKQWRAFFVFVAGEAVSTPE